MHTKQYILFIQGGGEGGYEADKQLADSLKAALGNEYDLHYPEIKGDESTPDFGWLQEIDNLIAEMENEFILVAHSFGASMVLKFLSENNVTKKIKGIFLLATPYWSGNEDWEKGLLLTEDFADKLSAKVPIYLYHCRDDEEIPVAHFNLYRQKLAQANFREINSGGHQFNNDLGVVANDIIAL